MARRRPRIRLALLLATALLALPGAEPRAEPADDPPVLDLPDGPPIQLDGTVLPAEWEGALEVPIGPLGARLRLRQCRGTLLLGFTTPAPWTPRSSLTIYACPDGPQAGWLASGFRSLSYEPLEHDRTHLIVNRNEQGRSVRLLDRAVARCALREGSASLELACGLDLFGVEAADSPPLRLCVLWVRAGAPKSASWPANLAFSAPVGELPPDLASVRRWATLRGWKDPAGPGAFPPSDWKAWLEHDREIASRGATAHAEVRGIVEEPKKTMKRDAEQVPAILESFEWIATHEPLTPNDLLATAQTLRWLNYKRRALGVLDALVQHSDLGAARRALYERALTNESMERYVFAYVDWWNLAARVGAPYDTAYRKKAKAALALADRWIEEQEARREDDERGDLPLVALHTARGVVLLQLFARDVPVAVDHFLGLVESTFYDGTLFHRVIGDFMAQGGDPISRDQGCEFAGRGTSPREVPMEINPRHGFWRGAVGFARKMRESNGSQFFIMVSPRPDLGAYTCFGRVVSGLEHVDRIEHCDRLIRAEVLRR